ncbi:hypothetical protein E0Z10_g2549 [Xylaria hypoxylon]|uniref:GPI anchored cell wall protein n=1 Tax=Xylaria hypoxylon TaxID=37992 RepID=A0A4Z0Z3G1_9PEZI|nr:hypothetical protein E0Z10_g2549 [Xylaria hypoxylon]
MYSTKLLIAVAALAGTSLSQKSDAAFCSSVEESFLGLFAVAPTTPAAILSFIARSSARSRVLPSSLLPEFADLGASLLDFGRDHSSEFVGYITNCVPEPTAASVSSYIESVFTATGNICTETATATPAPGSGASNGTYPTGTGSVYPTATSSFTLIPTAAAARPTGALLGAAAGILGAAAML